MAPFLIVLVAACPFTSLLDYVEARKTIMAEAPVLLFDPP
jgi:hypothetical protein